MKHLMPYEVRRNIIDEYKCKEAELLLLATTFECNTTYISIPYCNVCGTFISAIYDKSLRKFIRLEFNIKGQFTTIIL